MADSFLLFLFIPLRFSALPNAPSAYAVPINSTTVLLNWNEPEKSEVPSLLYAIVTEPNYPQVYKTREKGIEIPNLQPSTEYTFHVYATSDTGDYIFPGAEAKAKTWDADEANPSELKTVHLDFYGIRLMWKAVNYSERTKPLYTIVSNANRDEPVQTEETTLDFTKLYPNLNYVFYVYSTKLDGSFYMPGQHTWTSLKPYALPNRRDQTAEPRHPGLETRT
ncbi:hypothetical protein AAHC03_023043 [Spirometra sp. Aus1]